MAKWQWRCNGFCYFCQKDLFEGKKDYDILKDPSKGCDTTLTDIEGKLTAVFICEECFEKKKFRVCMGCGEVKAEVQCNENKGYYCNNCAKLMNVNGAGEQLTDYTFKVIGGK